MYTRFLRLPNVLDRRGVSRASHYNEIAAGTFVPPVKTGPNTAVWPEDEVETLIRARIAGYSDQQMRELVAQLVAQRRNALQGFQVLPGDK